MLHFYFPRIVYILYTWKCYCVLLVWVRQSKSKWEMYNKLFKNNGRPVSHYLLLNTSVSDGDISGDLLTLLQNRYFLSCSEDPFMVFHTTSRKMIPGQYHLHSDWNLHWSPDHDIPLVQFAVGAWQCIHISESRQSCWAGLCLPAVMPPRSALAWIWHTQPGCCSELYLPCFLPMYEVSFQMHQHWKHVLVHLEPHNPLSIISQNFSFSYVPFSYLPCPHGPLPPLLCCCLMPSTLDPLSKVKFCPHTLHLPSEGRPLQMMAHWMKQRRNTHTVCPWFHPNAAFTLKLQSHMYMQFLHATSVELEHSPPLPSPPFQTSPCSGLRWTWLHP